MFGRTNEDSSFRGHIDESFERSFEIQDMDNDDEKRRNQTAFKYIYSYHASLSEKLYAELCSLAFGDFDIENGQISPIMWTRLYDIFVETSNQTRKAPSDCNYSIISQKYVNEAVQISSVMAIFTALPHEYADSAQGSLLSQLIIDDIEFRRIFALLLWSEKAISEHQYETGLTERVRKLESIRSSRTSSIMALKRSHFAGPPKDVSLDPDSRGTDEDAQIEQNAINVMFQLVKSGEIAKAAELALNLGMGPLANQLMLHAMLRQPNDVPLDSNNENRADFKRSNRANYFTKLQVVIEKARKNEDDAHLLLLNAMRGNLKPILKSSKTIAEKVWAYANCAFLARMLAAEGSMSQEEIVRLFNVPMTAKSVIEELSTKNSCKNEVLILLNVIDALLYEEMEELFDLARSQVDGFVPLDPNCNVNVFALDIFFHMVAVSYLSGFDSNSDGDSVVAAQFDDLRYRQGTSSHRRMAAFYSRFLTLDEKNRQIVETMKLVNSEKERIIFAESLKQSELDFGELACSLIKMIREEDEMKVAPLEVQIEHWQWLLVGGQETALAAVEEMNRLLRKCLMNKNQCDELTIRYIIREAIRFDLPTLLSGVLLSNQDAISLIEDGSGMVQVAGARNTIEKIEHAMDEFLGHCTFMDLFNFVVTICIKLEMAMDYEPIKDDELRAIGGLNRNENKEHDWEASLRVRARAELTLREENAKRRTTEKRTKNEMVLQHVENAMPLLRSLLTNVGWRGEYFLAPKDNGDPMKNHRRELDAIRNKFVPKFFLVFAQASSKLNDMLVFIEFFSSFDPDSTDLGVDSQNVNKIFKVLADLNMSIE